MVTGVHGLHGVVRIKSFTKDPRKVAAYGPVSDLTGDSELRLTLAGDAKGVVLARIDGVKDREEAQTLVGMNLYVCRGKLPATEKNEYYYADLVGLNVKRVGGASYGFVRAVHNFGAGDILEIERLTGIRIMLPFNKDTVPDVDIGAGVITVDPPEGLENSVS